MMPRRVITATAVIMAALVPIGRASARGSAETGLAEGNSVFSRIDNKISFYRTFGATGPGHWSRNADGSINGKTEKQAYSFTHSDVWDYGTNYLDVSVYKSGRNDPAAPCKNAPSAARSGRPPNRSIHGRCQGQTEVYVVARSTLGLNDVLNTGTLTRGPLKNISLEYGFDLNHQNDYNAERKRALVAGLRFDFSLPNKGSLKIAPLVYYEFSNHSTLLECGERNSPISGINCDANGRKHFKPTWSLESSYSLNLDAIQGLEHFAISGRATLRGPKGNQNSPLGRASGGRPTKLEINSEPLRIIFDASGAWVGPHYSHRVDLWVAYRYWHNKFGLDADESSTCFTNIPGESNGTCSESSLSAGLTVSL
jgi:hypothetical protein